MAMIIYHLVKDSKVRAGEEQGVFRVKCGARRFVPPSPTKIYTVPVFMYVACDAGAHSASILVHFRMNNPVSVFPGVNLDRLYSLTESV